MASDLADKIKQTAEDDFPAQKPGAVAACPYATPVSKEEPPPVNMETAFALTQDITKSQSANRVAEPKQQKKAWIEIILVDMDGKPMPGVRYRITATGGEQKEGALNEHGQAGYYQIEPGNCKVTFPDLDKDAWD